MHGFFFISSKVFFQLPIENQNGQRKRQCISLGDQLWVFRKSISGEIFRICSFRLGCLDSLRKIYNTYKLILRRLQTFFSPSNFNLYFVGSLIYDFVTKSISIEAMENEHNLCYARPCPFIQILSRFYPDFIWIKFG